jgi:hypothetical protein
LSSLLSFLFLSPSQGVSEERVRARGMIRETGSGLRNSLYEGDPGCSLKMLYFFSIARSQKKILNK